MKSTIIFPYRIWKSFYRSIHIIGIYITGIGVSVVLKNFKSSFNKFREDLVVFCKYHTPFLHRWAYVDEEQREALTLLPLGI